MDSYTSINNSKSQDDFWINQKDRGAAYDWGFQNFNEKIKTHDPEKSQYAYQTIEREIICKIYDPYHDDFITINTVAYDINDNGLIFITNQALDVGDPIFIKAKNSFRKRHYRELDEGVHAKIISSNRTFNQKHNPCYEVGVEFFN